MHPCQRTQCQCLIEAACAQRLLNFVVPEAVHIMEAGRIIYSGGLEVADVLEADGYEGVRRLIRQRDAAPASVA